MEGKGQNLKLKRATHD